MIDHYNPVIPILIILRSLEHWQLSSPWQARKKNQRSGTLTNPVYLQTSIEETQRI